MVGVMEDLTSKGESTLYKYNSNLFSVPSFKFALPLGYHK